MLSVRAPDDSPLRLVLWQDQLCTLSTLLACLSQGASKFILEGSSDGSLLACNSREPRRKLAGQLHTFLHHVARLEGNLAGWLVCWVAAAGNSCNPNSEPSFVFKIHTICNQSSTQGGRSPCRMNSDLDATLSRKWNTTSPVKIYHALIATTIGNVSSSHNGKRLSRKMPCCIDSHHTAEKSFMERSSRCRIQNKPVCPR